MEWVDRCVDHLIGGTSINVTGLAGSGRSRALSLIAKELEESDWQILHWTPASVPREKRDLAQQLDVLLATDKIPVLIVDDYGEIVSTQNRWLDSLLFARTALQHGSDKHALRCVVATYPRDRQAIVSDGSGLLDRAYPMVPETEIGTQQDASRFGCRDASVLLSLTGGNSHLLSVGGSTPDERRGNVRSAALRWLPRWIGQLDEMHQSRLADIVGRANPATWKPQEADPVLAPLVLPRHSADSLHCQVLESVDPQEILPLLMRQPWPYGDTRTAARRFCARCGSDLNPLWVDNFLSQLADPEWQYLVEFLQSVTDILGSDSRIDILSRDWIPPNHLVSPGDIRNGLQHGGITDAVKSRLRWRIYDRGRGVNLHDRQLILRSQNAVFQLPPAKDVIGLTRGGNVSDPAVARAVSIPARQAWKDARVVL